MLGVILAGAVLGAASLILFGGSRGPQPKPVRVETKDRKKNAEDR